MSNKQLDCTQLRCPVPIVKISRAVKDMAPGQTLSVQATDPAFRADVEAWARRMGCTIVEFIDGPIQRVVIQKRTQEVGP